MTTTYDHYSSWGWGFPPMFRCALEAVTMVREDRDIVQSLRILFSTVEGERFLVPRYGCSLRRFLFDGLSNLNATHLKDVVAAAIGRWEKRVRISDLRVETVPEEGIVRLWMALEVVATGRPLQFVETLTL